MLEGKPHERETNMATVFRQSAHRRLAGILGFGLLMAVVFFAPSPSGAQDNTCPQNPAVAPLLTQCVTAPPDDVTDCPTLCPGPNCVDTLQEAVDAAANAQAAQVIGIFINTTENVVISAPYDLRIEQCRNAKITAEEPSDPVLHIQSTAGDGLQNNNVHPTTKDVLINGPDFIDGEVGIQVDNSSTEVKSIRALNNTFGILVNGSNNIITGSNGDRSDFAGIRVTGNNNTVKNSKALNNGNSGFEIVGSGNSVRSSTAEGNGIDGFFVAGGGGHTIQDNRANKNVANGFSILGLNSTVTRNRAERNSGDGFNVSSGSGNRLGTNTANLNTGDEFDVVAGNTDLGGNKANGASCPLPGVCP
jgi:Right handed beta helix region